MRLDYAPKVCYGLRSVRIEIYLAHPWMVGLVTDEISNHFCAHQCTKHISDAIRLLASLTFKLIYTIYFVTQNGREYSENSAKNTNRWIKTGSHFGGDVQTNISE